MLEGTLALSLKALGAPTVSGPMEVFKVADGVELRYRVIWVAASGI